MRRTSAILGTFVFLFMAPGFVAGVVPWWITHWEFKPPLLNLGLLRWLGAALLLIGVMIVLDSFTRFALQGLGTPAPVLPTRHLVVTGLYRYVRNPMYVGVAAAIFGQALLFESQDL
jgi:protein-S-isoprenylcysteine O-methyltransferase Ste14